MIDLKRTPADKKEEAQEMAPTPASQPDYGYGLCLHLEDEELKKLGITDLPKVGTPFRIEAMAVVKGVSERDYGANQESCLDLQIMAMDLTPDEMEDEAYDKADKAESSTVGGRTFAHSTYRGPRG